MRIPLLRNSRSFASCVAPSRFEVGRVRLLGAHLVGEARAREILRHLLAAAELVDELLVEPRLVDLQARVREQAVAVEPLDVVALVGRAVAPDVDVVGFHRRDQHRAGHGAPERRRVEIRDAGGRDVERARLDRRDPFRHQLLAAVDEARVRGAVLQRLARDRIVVGLVGLPEIGRVGVRDRTLLAHPVDRRAGVEAAGKCDADLPSDRELLEDRFHGTGRKHSALRRARAVLKPYSIVETTTPARASRAFRKRKTGAASAAPGS